MMIKWHGRTRRFLAEENNVLQIEVILRELSNYLGKVLVVDEETDENTCLDLGVKEGLIDVVHDELVRLQYNESKLLTKLGVQKVPHLRPSGSVHFKTRDGSKGIHLRFDRYELAPVLDAFHFGNTLSIESDEMEFSGEQLAEVGLYVMKTIFNNDLFDHGYCCLSGQYDALNLDRSEGGVRAMGLDASKWLPGFYWANYMGAYLCNHIGREKLLTVPGCSCTKLGSGILVTNDLPPDHWSDVTYKDNARSAMDYIGQYLFFEKGKSPTGTLFT